MKLIIESSTYNHSECGVEEEINDKTIGVGFRGLLEVFGNLKSSLFVIEIFKINHIPSVQSPCI